MSKKKRSDGTGHLYKRGRIWWVKFHHAGRSVFESSGSEKKQDAERLLARRLGEIATGKYSGAGPERITVGELLLLVLEDYEQSGKRSTAIVRSLIDGHVKPALGNIRAAELGTTQLKRYVDRRRREGAANASINRELSALRRAFTLALEHDPPLVARALHFPKLTEQNVRQGFLEYEQYRTLRDALPVRLRAVLVVAFHLGNRLGELRNLKWDQIDRAAGEIRLPGEATKNGQPRTLPVYGEMGPWLDMALSERDQRFPDCPWVFHFNGRRLGSHLKGWRAACEDVGMPDLLFHDLRRSAVRNMERAGIPRKVAMAITGHLTESVYRRYDIVSGRDIRAAGAKLEAYFSDSVVTFPVTGDTRKPS